MVLVPGFTDTPHDFLPVLEGTVLREGKVDWDFEVGFGFSGAVGYDFGLVRADAEVSYLSAQFLFDEPAPDKESDDTFSALVVMANGWLDLGSGLFAPYLGVGVGATNFSISLAEGAAAPWFEGSGWGLAYQAGAGLAVEVLPGLSLHLGYQFLGTLETTVFQGGDLEASSVSPVALVHRLQAGVRYRS